jgi:hypothetical protein
LDFEPWALVCLAGDPSYELCPGGADVVVDSSNLVRYIQAVVDASLGAGIDAQMAAFREGFNEVGHIAVLETGNRVSCCFAAASELCETVQQLASSGQCVS